MQMLDSGQLEKVCKNIEKQVNLAEDAPPLGIQAHNTNILIWRKFMSASMKASIHMGPDSTENLKVFKNTNFDIVRHHPEVGTQARRDSECENDSICISFGS